MAEEMVNYIYISKTKVNMFYQQISHNLKKKYSEELDIDLKEETLFSKLSILSKHLKNNEEVGSIDNPKKFFEGNITMKYALIRSEFGEETKTVYFTGRTKDTILGLGGSRKHLISMEDCCYTQEPSTTLGQLLMTDLLWALGYHKEVIRDGGPLVDYDSQSAILEFDKIWKENKSRLSFLALKYAQVQLAREGYSQKWTLFGSPLYVVQE